MRQCIHPADAPIDSGKAVLSQSWRSPGVGNAGRSWCFIGSRPSAGPVRSWRRLRDVFAAGALERSA